MNGNLNFCLNVITFNFNKKSIRFMKIKNLFYYVSNLLNFLRVRKDNTERVQNLNLR